MAKKEVIKKVFNRFIKHNGKLYKAGDSAESMDPKELEILLQKEINQDLITSIVVEVEEEKKEKADKKA